MDLSVEEYRVLARIELLEQNPGIEGTQLDDGAYQLGTNRCTNRYKVF